ncbi:MAG: hypothetical protein H6799_01150 [Candidatus Nomurabacteria bacterium]|nr:MAG: hypothetical protein H6799_01150 [Candidatus Nomurabacteria bacterium]
MSKYKGSDRIGGLFLMCGRDQGRISHDSLIETGEITLPSGVIIRGVEAELVRDYVGPGSLVVALDQLEDYWYDYVPVSYKTLSFVTPILEPCVQMRFQAETIGHRVLDLSAPQLELLRDGCTIELDAEELRVDLRA